MKKQVKCKFIIEKDWNELHLLPTLTYAIPRNDCKEKYGTGFGIALEWFNCAFIMSFIKLYED